MAQKDYVITKQFKSPYVISTGMPHKPTEIKFKKFNRGDMVKGELKYANGSPSFVLVKGTIVVPLSVVREVTTKEIGASSAEGGEPVKPKLPPKKVTPKMRYMDAAILGGLVGFGLAFYAEKRSWIVAPEDASYQNKLIGVVLGAAAGAYTVYRFQQPKAGTSVTIKTQE